MIYESPTSSGKEAMAKVKVFLKVGQTSWSRSYMSSCKSSKEGDLPLCILPKREISRETIL